MLNAYCYNVRDAVTLATYFDSDHWRNNLSGPLEVGMIRNDIAHDTAGRDMFVMGMRTRYPDSYKGSAE